LKHNYVKTNERRPYCQRQKRRPITLVSGNINLLRTNRKSHICRRSKAFLAGTYSNMREVVEIDEFAVFPLPYLRKFEK